MKKLVFCLTINLLYSLLLIGQKDQIHGQWKGTLATPMGKIELILALKKQPFSGKLSSSSGIQGITLENLHFEAGKFGFTLPGIKYKGVLKNDLINGIWEEGGMTVDLDFLKSKASISLSSTRPQTPVKPYIYEEREISIENILDGIKLAGTLTIPKGKGPFPAAILLSVAGANDRDQTHSLGHKPFLVLADHLTKSGIAVLRLDDRGVGQSEGNLYQANFENLTDDALAAFEFLQRDDQIDAQKIGFIGNSEGTVIAAMAAIQEPKVAFVVMLGAVGVPLSKLTEERLNKMQSMFGLSAGEREEIIDYWEMVKLILQDNLSNSATKSKLEAIKAENTFDKPGFPNHLFFLPESKKERIKLLLSPWYKAQALYQPEKVLRELTCPALIINGTLDMFQSPEQNFPAIQRALFQAGNSDFSLVVAPRINHVMQTAQTGFPTEYGKLEESFAPFVLKTIEDWIQVRFNLEPFVQKY